MNTFYILETLGICTFALSGLLIAKQKNFDPVGLYVIAFVTALGGGTLRDIILDAQPIYWVSRSEYPILILVLTILIYVISKIKIKSSWLIIPDAIGLALFTITGAETALSNHLDAIIVMILATVTACFGSLLRDILCHEVPMLFQKVSFYAFTAFTGSGLFISLLYLGVTQNHASLISIFFILSFRLLSYHYNWRFR